MATKKALFTLVLLTVFASAMVFAQTSSIITIDQFNAGITKKDDYYIYSTVNGRQYVVNKARQLPYKMWTGTAWEPVDVGPQRESDFEHTVTNGKATITGYKGTMINVVIPSTINGRPVVAIGDAAFAGGPATVVSSSGEASVIFNYQGLNLISVVIPDSVISIGKNAFTDNKTLTSIIIGNNVATIGASAFLRCGLTNVTFPNSLTSIDDFAFSQNMLTYVTIPNSVTFLGSNAFVYNRLSSITIGSKISSFDLWVFHTNINSLLSITIGANVTLTGGDTTSAPVAVTNFATAYNNGGKRAGTYTRPNKDSTVWTRQ